MAKTGKEFASGGDRLSPTGKSFIFLCCDFINCVGLFEFFCEPFLFNCWAALFFMCLDIIDCVGLFEFFLRAFFV